MPVPKTQAESNVLPVMGVVLLLVPGYLTARWIRIVDNVGNHEARVAEFSSILPHVLRDPLVSTAFALACAAAGTVVGAVCVVRFSGLRRLLGVAVLWVGGLLSGWFASTLL